MKRIRTVIFDMDGLMFDTERIAAQYWIQAGREVGLSVGEEFLKHVRGSGRKEAAKCTNLLEVISFLEVRDGRKTVEKI